MSDINEVRARLGRAVAVASPGSRIAPDIHALLAGHARLQASHGRLLKAAQYLQSHVVETRGVRCVDEMHAAIDAAKAVQS